MSNMIRTEMPATETRNRHRTGTLLLASLSLAMVSCSGGATATGSNEATPAVTNLAPEPALPAETNTAGEIVANAQQTGAPAPAPKSSDKYATSQVLGKSDKKMVSGKIACIVNFVYAGQEPQIMLWEEPCAKVDAGMIDRAKLEELGWWEKLDEYARKFVEGMPGGKVLYINGEFSASVFPVGTTGTPYEVEVAD
jgi:hypothetical protein